MSERTDLIREISHNLRKIEDIRYLEIVLQKIKDKLSTEKEFHE